MNIRDEHLLETNHTGLAKAEYRRLSGRTYEEFKRDIKKAHEDEREIIQRYIKFIKSKTGKELDFVDNGVDNSGEFIPVNQVKDDVDFIVNGKPMEVKLIKNNLQKFRLKLNLLKSYVKQDADVILVMGWETDSPQFTILKNSKIKDIIKYGKKEVAGDWEGKPSVYLYKSSFDWNYLPF